MVFARKTGDQINFFTIILSDANFVIILRALKFHFEHKIVHFANDSTQVVKTCGPLLKKVTKVSVPWKRRKKRSSDWKSNRKRSRKWNN